MADAVYINYEEGVKRVMNNAKFYVKMLGKFKDDNSLEVIDSALEAGDFEKAKVAAHTQKGLAGNLSLTELYLKSQELEDRFKNGVTDYELLKTVKEVHSQTLIEVEKVIAENG